MSDLRILHWNVGSLTQKAALVEWVARQYRAQIILINEVGGAVASGDPPKIRNFELEHFLDF